MKLFGKVIGKKEDDFGLPPEPVPDFSQPVESKADPLAEFKYDSQGSDPYSQDAFSHQIFTSDTPTSGDRARNYANSISPPTQGYGSTQSFNSQNYGSNSQSYGGTVTGHEAQLILEKLDTIKAEIDAVKQRLMRVERFMESAEQKAGQRRVW